MVLCYFLYRNQKEKNLLRLNWAKGLNKLFPSFKIESFGFCSVPGDFSQASSRRTDPLHVAFDRLRILLPCELLSSDTVVTLSGVFLRVWPIQWYFLCFIDINVGSSFVILHCVWLLILLGKNILHMIRRHMLMKLEVSEGWGSMSAIFRFHTAALTSRTRSIFWALCPWRFASVTTTIVIVQTPQLLWSPYDW